MSKLSLSVYLNAYNDRNPSNNPGQNSFKWNRALNSVIVDNPDSLGPVSIAPGENRPLFSGMRTLLQDGTTQYSISLKPFSTTTYVLSAVGGTLPNFRTPRTTGADATTKINTSVNGPLETFTSITGTFASFTGRLPGMLSNVTITANVVGAGGNAVVLTGDGATSVNGLISAWNIANPGNTITLTAGNGTQIPNAGFFASFTGTIAGTSTGVTITADNVGNIGNSVELIGDGVTSITGLISAWNIANPSNTITLATGDGTQIPQGSASAFYTGVGSPPSIGFFTPVTITAQTPGAAGNAVELIGDGASSVNTLIANWNIANPSNMIMLTAGNGGQIPDFGSLFTLAGGIDAAKVDLTGGLSANMQFSGGVNSTPLNIVGAQVGDYVTIGDQFSTDNQGTFKLIAFNATSFTIENPNAVIEGPITLGSGFASQIQIYSSTAVQVDDVLVISGGFSLATQGSYKISAVYANSVEFTSINPLPIEGPITTQAITIYSNAKTLIYIESDSTLSVIVNGVVVGNLEPFVVANAAQPSFPPTVVPGMFLLKSTVWSLAVQNNGLNSANVFFAAVE